MEGEQASSRSPTTPSNNTSDNADNGAAVIRSGLSDGFEICGCDKKSCSESIDILVDGQRWTIHMSCTGSSSMNFFSCRVCGAHQKFQKAAVIRLCWHQCFADIRRLATNALKSGKLPS